MSKWINNTYVYACVGIKGEITIERKYIVHCERIDSETKAEELLVICDKGFEKWYKKELFADKIKEVTKD